MHRLIPIAAVLVATAFPATALAQDAYPIKLKTLPPGVWSREVRNSVEVEATKVVDNAGAVLDDKKKTTKLDSVFDEKIVERPAGKRRATSLIRTYVKATAEVDGEAKVLPYQGKTVLIEKKDGKFRFSYEGGAALKEEEAHWLDKEFNKDADSDDFDFEALLLPLNPVKTGENWKIGMEPILKQLTKDTKLTADPDKSTGTGKLLKVSKQDGHQYGEWQFKVEFALKTAQAPGMEIKLAPGALLVLEGTYKGCIDGSTADHPSVMSMRLDAVFAVPADNPQARVTLASTKTGEEATTELPKK